MFSSSLLRTSDFEYLLDTLLQPCFILSISVELL